jgi:ATP-dependent Clp protease protease subunit
MNDFTKYAISHKGISRSVYDSYSKATTQHIIDDSGKGIMVDVFSKMLEERVIFICTELDSDICNILKAQLLYLDQIDSASDIKIYIDSPGGSVYSGLGLLDTMDFVSPDIVTVNTGLAASMAAIVLASGTKGKRRSLKRSRTMIHQPLGFLGYAQASDFEIDSKQINELKKELYEILAEKTGQPFDKIQKDSDRDYWMNSKDCLEYGIIDKIVKSK